MTIPSRETLLAEIEDLRIRLEEAKETLDAIRRGAVDALLVSTPQGEQVFTLRGADSPYRILIEEMHEGALTLSLDRTILYSNLRFAEMVGTRLEEVIGSPVSRFLDLPALPISVASSAHDVGQAWSGDLSLHVKTGSTLPVHASVTRHSRAGLDVFFLVVTDISERKEAELHLRRMQKMEALGRLAGGIAHDFNNILSTIVINTELTLLDAKEENIPVGHLQLVLEACQRGKEVVRQIITFSRHTEQAQRPVYVYPVIKETLNLLRTSLPSEIEIDEDLSARTAAVLGDPTQIHQVLMNLCTNAAHAMRETGGLLGVKLARVTVDPATPHGADLKSGDYICLTVSDDGHGMSPDVMERIFDPFFTTKSPGEGTGMGLAVVHGIVKGWGGAIDVESKVGKGSTFDIFIPEIQGEPGREGIVPDLILGKKERVLLVEDEEDQLHSFQNMLERIGYRVRAWTSSLDALADFQASPRAFDIIITDQAMPKMTGIRLAEAVLKIRPDIPVILCTGFSEVVDAAVAKAVGVRELVIKPFGLSEFSAVMRRALGG